MLVVSKQGAKLLLEAAIGKAPASNWVLRLFTNDHAPVVDDTEADYIEAQGGGYQSIPLIAADWTTDVGAATRSTHPKQTFAFTGPLGGDGTLHGYYVTAGSQLLYAEKFAAAFTPANNGDTVAVTPVLSLENL